MMTYQLQLPKPIQQKLSAKIQAGLLPEWQTLSNARLVNELHRLLGRHPEFASQIGAVIAKIDGKGSLEEAFGPAEAPHDWGWIKHIPTKLRARVSRSVIEGRRKYHKLSGLAQDKAIAALISKIPGIGEWANAPIEYQPRNHGAKTPALPFDAETGEPVNTSEPAKKSKGKKKTDPEESPALDETLDPATAEPAQPEVGDHIEPTPVVEPEAEAESESEFDKFPWKD